ncbi:hypothetical protein MHTCC0001_15490 [Flavobacteriaceae bacterium MHTCC 0001]
MKKILYTIILIISGQFAMAQVTYPEAGQTTYVVTTGQNIEVTDTQSIVFKPGTHIQSGATFSAKIISLDDITTANDAYTNISFSNENYVFTRQFQAPMASFNASTAKEGDVIESITYFDGLGRPKQSIGIKAAPDKKDILTHISYDAFGRQDKEWLPYHELSGTLGTYRGDKATAIQQYYKTHYAADFSGLAVTDVNAFSQKDLEASPLSRVLKQAAPGADWKLGTGHEIAFGYHSNTANEVRRFNVTTSFNNNTYIPTLENNTIYYGEGELYKTITKDENWTSGTNHTTEEFKDKQGRVVLKRTYADVGGVSTPHDTYYAYDDFGNLSYVIPPKVTVASISSTELNELCYQYKYDTRNRLVEKKIPGKGWEFIVYNKLDQPVMTQDALQRPKKEWLFTKYDAFGRVVYTGIYTHATVASRTQMVTAYTNYYTTNTSEDLFENKIGTEGNYHYYSNGAFPTTNSEVLTVNYYDDYSFDGFTSFPSSYEGQTIVNHNNTDKLKTKGLPTASKVRVLGTNHWITTITGYDVKGRPVYVASNNSYLSTSDVVKSKLDFAGKVEKIETTHNKTGHNPIVTTDSFVYDHAARLISQKQKINDLPEERIVFNTYDNLGQLVTKGVGGSATSTNRLQTIDYTYNVRGWLQSINNTNALGNDLFTFALKYNEGTNALYNGNISSTQWRSANADNSLKTYTYTYDALNRVTSGIDNTGKYNLQSVTYDKNGNIMSLTRHGWQDSSNYNNMDVLNYDYFDSETSNKLYKVADAGNDNHGFKDSAVNDQDYWYDANGNMTKDDNKGITAISYNHLNLPTSVALSNSEGNGAISYIYDATGTKLKKVVSTGATTEYAGNYVYEGSSLKFFNHPEGYVDAENDYSYVYQYKDHLGNVRLSYKDIDGNGNIEASEILEENNFYPFGLKHKGYNNTPITNHKYERYNGKEYEEFLGLSLYEMDVRSYDPAVARFTSIDPVVHHSYSTYNAFDNNPVFWADPSGADAMSSAGGGADWSGFELGESVWERRARLDAQSNDANSDSTDGENSSDSNSESENSDPPSGYRKFIQESNDWIFRNFTTKMPNWVPQTPFDARGYELYFHWANGTGRDLSYVGGLWGEYMSKNEYIVSLLNGLALENAMSMQNSKSTDYKNNGIGDFYFEIQNGYFTGYEMLHGTQYFSILSTVGKYNKSDNTYSFTFDLRWNDRINPNLNQGDGKIAPTVRKLNFDMPKDYNISIKWSQTIIIKANSKNTTLIDPSSPRRNQR